MAFDQHFQNLQLMCPVQSYSAVDGIAESLFDGSFTSDSALDEEKGSLRLELDLRDIIDVSKYADLFEACNIPDHGLPTPDDSLLNPSSMPVTNGKVDTYVDPYLNNYSNSTFNGPATPPIYEYNDELEISTIGGSDQMDSGVPWILFAVRRQNQTGNEPFPQEVMRIDPSGQDVPTMPLQQSPYAVRPTRPSQSAAEEVNSLTTTQAEQTRKSQMKLGQPEEKAMAQLRLRSDTTTESSGGVSKRKFSDQASPSSISASDYTRRRKQARSSTSSEGAGEDAAAKRKSFLARNAGAARRTRQKKKDFVTHLEMRLGELEVRRVEMLRLLDPLIAEVEYLRGLATQHKRCRSAAVASSMIAEPVVIVEVDRPLDVQPWWVPSMAVLQSGADSTWSRL
ncbi:MAG: hypothetical protein M1818_005650 [Claussenomyces sp. TS43310]|nr:MAG: hypothetical protein M1818_005650 [Claussenomyces sp. TS43310]